MTVAVLYLLAVLAVAVGAAAVCMAMPEPFPLRWLYRHYFVRKPVVWSILLVGVAWVAWMTWQAGTFPRWTIGPLALMGLGVLLACRMHQEEVPRFVSRGIPLWRSRAVRSAAERRVHNR